MRRLIIFILPCLALAHSAPAQPSSAPAQPSSAPARPSSEARTLPAPEPIAPRIARAAPGDTIIVGPGTYREHLRIDKPLRLIGQGRPVIDGGGSGDIVEITAPGVEFRGFLVRDTGIDLDKENAGIRVLAPGAVIQDNILEDILFGIDLRESPASTIRNNRIGGKDLDIARRGDGLRLWRSDNTLIEGNAIHDGRDAILWYSRAVTVRGNTSARCRYGFHLMYSDDAVLESNTLAENSVGIYIMYSRNAALDGNRISRSRGPSGYGVGLKEVDGYSITGNLIAANRVGVYLDGSPFNPARPGEFRRNTFARNDIGMVFLPSVRGNRLSENNFIDNTAQVSIQGRGTLSGNDFSIGQRGNFWTDYVGYDQDHDGVGDFVHESQTLFENMLDQEPKLRLILFSPAQQAVELVGRALPAVRPEAKFEDQWPLMTPVEVRAAVPAASSRSRPALAGAAAGLLAAGAAVLLLARAPSLGARP